VIQVALCFVLVSACLLSVHGLQRAFTMNLGFQPQGVSIAGFELGLAGYTEEKGRNFRDHAVETIAALPGVQSVSYSNSVPLSIDQSTSSIYPEDQPSLRTSESQCAIMYQVSPQFFRTMQIELLTGREFNWHDDAKSNRVAVVNRAFAKRVLRADSPLGRRFRCGPGGELTEVVGEAEDGKYESLADSNQPAVFVPILQQYNSTTVLEVRSSLPDNEITERIRQTLAGLDPELPLYSTGSLVQLLGFAFFPMKAAAIALSFFGMLAAMLAITGIYGLVSYSVASRTREIGIRVAMGANSAQVLKLVAGRTAALLAAGSVFGLLLALAAGRVLRSVIYGASAHDPRVLLSVFLTIVVLGLASSWGPTLRALRIDPAIALRRE
jgi:predicted permease